MIQKTELSYLDVVTSNTDLIGAEVELIQVKDREKKLDRLIKQALNPRLEIEGILLTMFDGRNNLSHQVIHEVKSHFKNKVFETIIPRNIRLSEAPSHGKPALLYDIHSKGAESYLSLAREIMANGKINGN